MTPRPHSFQDEAVTPMPQKPNDDRRRTRKLRRRELTRKLVAAAHAKLAEPKAAEKTS